MPGTPFSGVILRLVARAMAILLTAAAVRMLDDAFDENLATTPGTMAYLLALLALGAMLHPETALTLFLACYACGMMTADFGRRLPSGLTGLAEGMLAIAMGGIKYGWQPMMASLAVIVFVQAVDDVLDFERDSADGVRTWATQFGPVETFLVAAVAFSLALGLDPFKAIIAPLVAVLVTICRDVPLGRGEES